MSFWVLKLTEDGSIDEMLAFETHGLATQKTHEFTDQGFACRIVPPELEKDALYLFEQVKQEKKDGFVPERGAIPNGHRSKEGARSIGRMIFPAFGGLLEEHNGAPGSDSGGEQQQSNSKEGHPSPLTLSSKRSEMFSQKISTVLDKLNGSSS